MANSKIRISKEDYEYLLAIESMRSVHAQTRCEFLEFLGDMGVQFLQDRIRDFVCEAKDNGVGAIYMLIERHQLQRPLSQKSKAFIRKMGGQNSAYIDD